DLYLLSVPTGSATECNTTFVYNLRAATWSVWTLADPVTSLLYNISSGGLPQIWFTSNGTYTKLWQFVRGLTYDRNGIAAAGIIPTIQTSWLSFGNASMRHFLNSIMVQTADTGMTVTIDAADTIEDFASPVNVVTNAA